MLEFVANILESETFWIAIGSLGAVFTLFIAYLEIRASRVIAAADFLLRLESRFCSNEMVKKRKKFILLLKDAPEDFERMDSFRDVFDFFEDLGLLLRKGIIPIELVWSNYCHWILNYWVASQGYVNWARNKDADPTLYCEFEILFKRIRTYEERRIKRKVNITLEKTMDFINDELRLLSF